MAELLPILAAGLAPLAAFLIGIRVGRRERRDIPATARFAPLPALSPADHCMLQRQMRQNDE